ncbi:uroporphyrinogen-III synthase [Amyelois transitella]|uniref:uroporphyrinogen-III synthase n=1 Tax=Amyelois transitella TaxID=680683 RepID=UPI00067A8D31|nr:uroporphyrinogen-III synthase [Amyelois transitella]
MRKVVLFKGVSEDYEKVFSDNNYEVVFVEPLQFSFINRDQLREKLDDKQYEGLILTSPRAIEAVGRCWDPAKYMLWNTKTVYTVGHTSCQKINRLLGLGASGASSGNAVNLAKLIISENSKTHKFLFPCGNLRSETLPNTLTAAELSIDALTVYETKENENLRRDLMELNESAPACMVFFSPSGCEYIYRQLQTFNNRLSVLPHFAIGNSTAHKIENLGLEIAGVAQKPEPESIMESIKTYFASTVS